MNQTFTKPVSNKPRRLPVIGQIALRALFIVVLLALSGAAYQAIGSAQDAQRFPAPGQTFEVGRTTGTPHRLHLYCMGQTHASTPTVILETMSGGSVVNWAWIQPELAKTTRACAYDRAGLGWSETKPQLHSLQQAAQDLHTLLATADVAGPYVLVGHSLGGLYVRQFATLYPDEVAGVVLLDSSHPGQFERHPEMWAKTETFLQESAVFPALAQLGLFRLFFALGGEMDFDSLPARQHAELVAFWSSPNYWHRQRTEIMQVAEIYAAAQQLKNLGHIPLIVISADQTLAPGWSALQTELAQLSSNATHVTLPGSQHASLAFNPNHAAATSALILRLVNQ